jgi:predicted RNA-binding protein with PIN domain
MSYIIIDGYNLIGTAHKNLQKARRDIVEKLSRYSAAKGHNITLVFDGWKGGQATESKQRVSNITLIYSRAGENADTLIKRVLNEDRKPWIVVSSDREISDYAYQKDCLPVNADEFEDKLFACLRIAGSDEPSEGLYDSFGTETDTAHIRRRGNPKKLSRKQKKKLQALEKL